MRRTSTQLCILKINPVRHPCPMLMIFHFEGSVDSFNKHVAVFERSPLQANSRSEKWVDVLVVTTAFVIAIRPQLNPGRNAKPHGEF